MDLVRDRFWIWGHEAGSHTSGKAKEMWRIPGTSRMTPMEAACYMGIPNCAMVVFNNLPEPPFLQHTLALSSLKQVVWSLMGDAGSTRNDQESDVEEVLRLAGRFPNITGAVMDDFFHRDGARYSVEETARLHDRLRGAPRPLDLWVAVNGTRLDEKIGPHLEHCDVVVVATWLGSQLVDLERTVERFVAVTPNKRRMLGCYLWNYGEMKPMPVEWMRHQCELGLQWLRTGQIDGIVFVASCICDLELEAVEWTRSWIAEVGQTDLADL
jgi:hypothetical protein